MAKFSVKGPNIKFDPGLLTLKQFKKVAQQELENTKARLSKSIQQGKDADGISMKKYSDSYTNAIKKGYVKSDTGVRKTSTRVNLTISSKMLKSRQVKGLFNGAELKFLGERNEELAGYNLALRPNWHALGKKDLKRIQNRIDKETKKIAEKIFKGTK